MESTTIVNEEAPPLTETTKSLKKLNLNNQKKESDDDSSLPRPTTIGGSRTLFVANLSFQIQISDIVDFFKEAGQVVDVRFATNREDGSFKGYGHVEFASPEEANKALGFNRRSLLGREVRLDVAIPYSKS